MKIHDITHYLEVIAPSAYQEDYDNSGLLTSHENDITGILVSLDCTEAVIDEAIERGCNLVVAHHPIVFRGLKRFTGKNYVERTVIKALKNDIAIYAIHTNLDNVPNGVNAKISEVLGLTKTRILSSKSGVLSKLATFVPKDSAENLRKALFAAGAGHIGNYDECSFNVEGMGTFRAGEGTNPFIGKHHEQHQESETKIEVIFPSYLKNSLVKALKLAHPYEEVAYDIVSLSNENQYIGSGMVGDLEVAEPLLDFLQRVKTTFGAGVIKYAGSAKGDIKKVAVCGGSGFFLLPAAIGAGADVFLTGDVKYHEFFDAEDKILLADMGHFESEQFTIDLLVEELKKKFTTFAVLKVNTNTNPVKYL
jgi:dinuclear metal center YbgI/SA1388 family protein